MSLSDEELALLLDDGLESDTLMDMVVELNKNIEDKSIKRELPKQDLEILQGICSYNLDNYLKLKSRLIAYYKKAKIDGLLSLETSIKAEKNKTVTEIYMLCIDGYSSSFVSNYMDIKAFWLIDLAKRDSWKTREYLLGLAKELYLIKKLALSTMQGKDVKIRANFSDIRLDVFKFTKIKEKVVLQAREEIDKYFINIEDIDDSSVIDIKYFIDLMQKLSYSYRCYGVEAFIDNSLKLLHNDLSSIFTKPLLSEGLEEISARSMLSRDRDEFYKNKELFMLHLAVRYILDGYAPRSVEEIVKLVYPEVTFEALK